MTTERINIGELKQHPHNPRMISAVELAKLVQSLRDFPEMLETRRLVINQDNEILGGNMRHRAMEILHKEGVKGFGTVLCDKVDWTLEKQKEFIIKDNLQAGDWDFDVLGSSDFFSEAELEMVGFEETGGDFQAGNSSNQEIDVNSFTDKDMVMTFKFPRETYLSVQQALSDNGKPSKEEALLHVLGL